MGRGFGITAAVGHDVVRDLAPEVERLGYTSFWVNDMPGADGLASLGVALAVTSDIDLGVGVIPLDRRPAPTIAAHVSELRLPLDRLVLGVGSGNAKQSLALVSESVGALKAELPTCVVVGALGPKMSVVAGEVADGVLFNWMTPEHIAKLGPSVHGSLMAYVRCALLPEAYARLTEEVRPLLRDRFVPRPSGPHGSDGARHVCGRSRCRGAAARHRGGSKRCSTRRSCGRSRPTTASTRSLALARACAP